MHFFILTIIAAAIAFAGFAPAYAQVNLRAAVAVNSADISVRDIFPGAESDAVIAKTPAPGRRLILDAYTLQRIAKRHKVRWQPRTRLDQAIVTRESRILNTTEIEAALQRSLTRNGMPESQKVELTNRSTNIRVAANMAIPYRIDNAIIDGRSRRVSAILSVSTEGREKLNYRLEGFTYSVIEVPVLNRRIRRGEVIGAGDVIWKNIRKDSVGRNVVRERKGAIGQAARRYLASGVQIMIDDLEPPKLVRKGSLVTIHLESANLRLTAKARASEDGALNDTIRVVNVRSKRTVEAIVRSPSKVIIPIEFSATN
jgi:flagellar basal body P-ring formation protein FlgA